jgi:hypothetical protein
LPACRQVKQFRRGSKGQPAFSCAVFNDRHTQYGQMAQATTKIILFHLK